MRAGTLERRGAGILPVVVVGGLAGLLGIVAGVSPLIAMAIGGLAILALLPWPVLFAILAFAAIYSKGHGFSVAGVNLQYSHAVLIPLAARTLLLTNPRVRNRWYAPEYCLIGLMVMQFLASFAHSPNLKASLAAAGLLTLGALTYLTAYTGICTRDRLIFVAKVVLYAGLLNATIGVVASLGHYATHASVFNAFLSGKLGTHRGVSGLPRGLVVENNIYGSFTAATGLAFYVLMRERNRVFSRRFATLAFWVCLIGTILSSTRGAWVGFIVAFIALKIFRRRHGRRASPVAGIGLMALLVGTFAVGALWLSSQPPTSAVDSAIGSTGAPIATDASQLINFGSGTGASRLAEWRIALQDLRRSPLLGLGTNSYGQRHLAFTSTDTNPQAGYLGNLYVRTLYDSGIVGFMLLLFFLIPVMWPPRGLQASPGDLAPVARAFLFGYIVIAVAFAATDASFQPWPWLFLGCARAATALALKQYAGIRRDAAARALPTEGGPAPDPVVAGNGSPAAFPGSGPVRRPPGPSPYGRGRR